MSGNTPKCLRKKKNKYSHFTLVTLEKVNEFYSTYIKVWGRENSCYQEISTINIDIFIYIARNRIPSLKKVGNILSNLLLSKKSTSVVLEIEARTLHTLRKHYTSKLCP